MSRKGQIFKKSVLKTLLHSRDCCIALVPSTRLLALPPFFLNDMKSGIIYLLNSILKKYDRTLDGILIGYQNIKVLMDENTGIIQMGTAETEVNVSVEFYIFQPKIGNHLQGVVNKKSNNHIGCLVHKYFNATILKPEDVEYEDWVCKDLNIDDKIVFKVKDLDFTGLLPYIEGTIDDDELRDRLKVKKESGCNVDSNVLIGGSENEMCSPKKGKCEVGSTEGTKDIVKKNAAGEELIVDNGLNHNVNRLIENRLNDDNLKSEQVKMKKKKEKKKKSGEIEKKEISCTVPKLVDEIKMFDKDQLDGKRKKKKKKKEKVDDDELSYLPRVENLLKEALDNTLDPKNLGQEEDDRKLNNLIEGGNKKKKKKDKKVKDEDEEKVNKCLVEKEENIFHSTQLEPFVKKMEMSFCSPIPVPQETATGEKKRRKKKQKEVHSTADTTPKGDALNTSKKEKSNKNRKRRERDESDEGSKKLENSEPKDRTTARSSSVKNGCLSESGDEKSKSTVQSLLEEIYREQMNRVRQEWKTPDRESSSSEAKAVSKKESKKRKKEDSLYEKLMKQARIAINLENEPPKVSGNDPSKRESSFSSSVGSAGKSKKEKERVGKKERKRKGSEIPEGPPSPKKLKNGSMYLMDSSPEKVKEDTSLFSDPESVKSSPSKKKKQINGDVSGSEVVKCNVESTTEERVGRGERESGKEKREKGSGKSGKKVEDSLYEKLLRDAKSLINSTSDEAPFYPKKESKKQKTPNAHMKSLC